MEHHTTLSVHIDITAMPDGYDEAIRRAITTATHRVLPDIDVTMLVVANVTVGAAYRVAAALMELMYASPTPEHRFAFTVWEEPAYEWPGPMLRYTPDTGLVSDWCDGEGQPLTTAAGIQATIAPGAGAADPPDIGIGDRLLIEFDPVACRAWLEAGAAGEASIDDEFRTANLTIAAGLEELLALLNHDATQRAWRPAAQVHQVVIWRTGDSDGIDGGALLTVDLDYPLGRIRLGCLHQGFDDFITDASTYGIDAAVEALGHVADVVNHTYTIFRTATQAVTAHPGPADPEDDATANPG